MTDMDAFRSDTRRWLEENCPPAMRTPAEGMAETVWGGRHPVFPNEDARIWLERAVERGFTVPEWPVEYGGAGLSKAEAKILRQEMRALGCRAPLFSYGISMLAPVLFEYGSDAQKARHLPPIARGEIRWCQGYSEPGAGSDLASLQCRAVRQGDEYVVDGQKIWTSGAAWSDWCFVLCRTDADAKPKQAGISYLLVPMKQDGITIRPILQMTGDSEFSEVFYDGARTARDNVVGEINDGWRVSQATLAFERGASTLGQQLGFQNELDEIISIARRNGRIDDPLIRQRLAGAWIGLRIQRFNALRTLCAAPGSEAARAGLITKLHWATWHRDLGKLAMDVLGAEAEVIEAGGYELSALQRMYLFTRADTLYGGTNEIQRNIIAEKALGLPRDPRPTEPPR